MKKHVELREVLDKREPKGEGIEEKAARVSTRNLAQGQDEDTGAPDTGAPDTGAPDTGAPDTGAPDTGAGQKAAKKFRFRGR